MSLDQMILLPGMDAAYGAPSYDPTVLNLDLWLEARRTIYSDAGTTPCNATDLVRQWNDLSTNHNNVSQATSGSRPSYQVVSGKPVVRTSAGSANVLDFTSTINIPNNLSAVGFTAVFVVKSASGVDHILASGNAGAVQIRICQATDKMSTYDGINNPLSTATANPLTNWNVLSYRVPANSDTVTFYEGTTTRGTASFSVKTLALSLSELFKYLNASSDVAAVFIKASAITDQEHADLVAYAAALHP